MADLVEGNETLLKLTLISTSDRTARDLTGGSVDLIWSIDGGTATTSSMTLVDAANGVVSYRFTDTQLTPGRLRADVRSTDASGNTVIANDVLSFLIRRKIS
jgi:hypothetical protein